MGGERGEKGKEREKKKIHNKFIYIYIIHTRDFRGGEYLIILYCDDDIIK